MVNGIAQNYGYGNYYLNNSYYNPVQMQQGAPNSVYGTDNNITLTGGVEERKDNTADGKDDGSIGFWGATKNLAKGAWNFLTSPFKNERGEWSLKSTLKSAAIAGLFIAGNALTGGALTPILLAGGAIAGVWGAGKAAYNIATAETDAQAEAAWQSMGSSTATIVATAVGAKGYAKAQATASGMTDAEISARYGGLKGIKNSVGKTFVDAGSNIKAGAVKSWDYSSVKLGQIRDAYKDGTLKTKLSDKYHTTKDNIAEAYAETKDALSEARKAWKAMTPDERKEVISNLKKSVKDYAKENIGSNRKEVWNTTKTVVSDPRNLAIHSNLASQTVKPDFYDSLSAEEQAQFDALPKEQQEQIKDTYYDLV